jgi:hypothetical protein
MPALAILLGVFHLAWFVAFWFGTYVLEETGLKYNCDGATLLRIANYRQGCCTPLLLAAMLAASGHSLPLKF